MAYDEVLTERIRDLILGRADASERKMFGGLAFMVNGHMAIAASGQGGILARVDPAEGATLLEREHVGPMVMRGRPMRGWLRVDGELVADDAQLQEWVDRCVAFTAALPPKGGPALH